ncbi:hypothetical protein GQ457_07G027600 [Hibiscus cannabinus]
MIQSKSMLELLLSASLKPRSCEKLPHHLVLTYIWVNVHSGTVALFMPYDHKKSTPDGLPSQRTRALIEELNKVHCHGRCKTGSGGASVGFVSHIFAGDKTLEEDCFKMYNPVDQTTFERVLNQWCATLLALFKLGPREFDMHSTNNR